MLVGRGGFDDKVFFEYGNIVGYSDGVIYKENKKKYWFEKIKISTAFVRMKSSNQIICNIVDCVDFFPEFENENQKGKRIFTGSTNPYERKQTVEQKYYGWNEFNIKIIIHFKSDLMLKPLELEHTMSIELGETSKKTKFIAIPSLKTLTV